MKLGILSCSLNCYSTRRLKEAAILRGHSVKVLNTLKFAIDLDRGEPDLHFRQKPLSDYDAILPRIGASITYFGTAVVRQFEQMDVFTANTSSGIANSRDKLRSLQILSKHHIGIPKTTFVRDRKDVLPAIERVGGAPVIIKLLEGAQGRGVVLAETQKAAESVINAMKSLNANLLVQEFIKEAAGKDLRCFVIGGKVVSAIERTAAVGDFRSNIHQGGSAEPVRVRPEERKLAIAATRALGLDVAGVDIIRSERGPLLLEVNSSPGLEGIETATGKDIAGLMIQAIERKLSWSRPLVRAMATC